MPARSAIFALLLSAAVGAAAEPQLRTLADTSLSGELVGISGKAVILKVAGKNVETPLDQVLTIDFASVPKYPPATDAKYIDVELTDGTLLHCERFAMKGKEAQLTMLSGQALKFPLEQVRWYLHEPNDRTLEEYWDKFLAQNAKFDQLVIKPSAPVPGNVLDSVKGTVGDADKDGTKIDFTPRLGPPRKISPPHGIIFQRDPNPKAAPVVCKVYDIHANVIVASAVALEGDKVNVTTPDGVKLELASSSLARLDYSRGKLVYLSDWDSKVIPPNPLALLVMFRRDKNLDGGPITLAGRAAFSKGLAIHARAALEYDLAGEFREFKAVIGVDELVPAADGVTKVVFKGDGKELKIYEVSRKDKPLDVTLSIHKVKVLTIEVLSAGKLPLGHHVDLADARVTK